MIKTLIQRSYKIASDWNLFEQDMKRLKQTLINNGYSNSQFDKVCSDFVDSINNNNENNTPENSNVHEIFYQNQMSDTYKIDEKVIKTILKNNVKCNNENDKLKLIIYYKNKKTASLVMKNNQNPVTDTLKRSNIVYQFDCNLGDCRLQSPLTSYI